MSVPHFTLQDYQQRFVDTLRGLIQTNWFRNPPHLRILDSGCDTSGRQLRHLASLTLGEVVGINPASGFPSEAAVEAAGARVSMFAMDGTQLDFPDGSFDLVVSANVMEHVPNPEKYIRECFRVLRPGGMAYIETSPVWTGARGHHIHEDMVLSNCPAESQYRNDGSVIPDWSHLTATRTEFEQLLRGKLNPETCRYILKYLYETKDLNRVGWKQMRSLFESVFPLCQITTWGAAGSTSQQAPRDGFDEYQVQGFNLVGRKVAPKGLKHAISRRLIWRLRKTGW